MAGLPARKSIAFPGTATSGVPSPASQDPAALLAGQENQQADQSATGAANAASSRNQFTNILSGGQSALETSVTSAMSAAMPEFRKAMQGVQESEVNRGIGLGDAGSGGGLGTSYEGDLQSSFQRNIANAAGQQAAGVYGTQVGGTAQLYGEDSMNSALGQNRYLSLLSGNRDYNTAQTNAANQRKSGLFGTLGALAGAGIGSLVPGIGTVVGAQAGGMLGGLA